MGDSTGLQRLKLLGNNEAEVLIIVWEPGQTSKLSREGGGARGLSGGQYSSSKNA